MKSGMVASGSAWVLHDLSTAVAFGGAVFGKLALDPAVRLISSPRERAKVLSAAWGGYNILNAIATGAAGATWLAGRAMLSGREIDRKARGLVIAKDVLIGTSVATGAACIAGNIIMAKDTMAGGAASEAGGGATRGEAEGAGKRAGLKRFFQVVGTANLLALAGVIGVTTVLAQKSGQSAKWNILSRFLP